MDCIITSHVAFCYSQCVAVHCGIRVETDCLITYVIINSALFEQYPCNFRCLIVITLSGFAIVIRSGV